MLQCIYVILQILNIELNIGIFYLKYYNTVILYTRKGGMANDIVDIYSCIFLWGC